MPTVDLPGRNNDGKPLDQVKRELARRSNDRVQVYNPLGSDVITVWDGFRHRVRAGENAVMPRYIAEKYVRETVNFMIGQENLNRVAVENKRRIKSGQKEMDPQERERFDYRKDNPEIRKKFIPLIYKGVVEEYGMDEPPVEQVARRSKPDFDIDFISQIDAKRTEPVPDEPETEQSKEALAKKIAA